MDKIKISTANLVILIAGGVMLIASFLDFQKFSLGSFSKSVNAWSNGSFLIATIPALLGTLMAVHVALESFAPQVALPERILGLTTTQVHLVFALQATIMMLAFLIQDISPGSIGRQVGFRAEKGVGLFLMLIAAIGLLVGALMRMREKRGRTTFG
jgi:hypothetical protein